MRASSGLPILFLAGSVSALGFAPLNLWPLTILALAWLIHRTVATQSWRAAARQGWVFAYGHFLVGLNWIATAFNYQQNMPAWIGWLAVAVLSLYLALFPALACAVAWLASRRRPLALIFMLSAAWMLGEWIRATLFTGFAWNPMAAVWLEAHGVAHAATAIGTYGLSGLVLLAAGLLWLLAMAATRSLGRAVPNLPTLSAPTVASVPNIAPVAVIVVITGAVVAAASYSPSPVSGSPGSQVGIPFRIVQPNIGQEQKYDPHEADKNTELYARLSGSPGHEPRLLLWPEGATLRFLDIEPDARAEVATLLGPHDLLITGGPSVDLDLHGDNDVYHNSVFAMDSSATLRWRYDKAHLVPFGEYLPLRPILSLIGFSRLVPGEGDFSFGPGPRTFPLPGFASPSANATAGGAGAPVQASVGVQICYEIIFSGHVVDESHRPTFLFNPSNDAWFGSWGPPQHLAQARLRAIEEGIAVLRATPNGISAVVDPTGQLIATLPGHREGVIDGVIPSPRPPTLFARFGLWSSGVWGALLALVGLALRNRP